MWRDYSVSYIKNNKVSSISIMVAAFISAMFLSLICSLFFNMWNYNVQQVVYEEGDWQGRLVGNINDSDLEMIKNFAGVENVIINNGSESGAVTVNIYFKNMRNIYQELPQIAENLGIDSSGISYHEMLLSQYLIFDPQDEQPPLLLLFFLLVLCIASISLILIIRNAFSVSMTARIHQFGILSSVGATPAQIRVCLLQEAAALCILPIVVGSFMGIGLCAAFVAFANYLGNGYHSIPAVFRYHIGIWLVTILASFLTVFLSAWFPARKLSHQSPLEAVRMTAEQQVKGHKNSYFLFLIFGMEGELAGNSLKARKKALRTTTLSLTLAFLAFTMFLCFMSLSSISTKYTYFERYKDAWDIMVTVKDAAIAECEGVEKLTALDNVDNFVVYQKAAAYTTIPANQQSEELMALGGILAVAGDAVKLEGDTYLVKMPLVILDDESFIEYCRQIGIEPQTDGGVIINHIWDSINSNFRYKEYIPYVKETEAVDVKNIDGVILKELPVIGYTSDVPVLREEYENYALVQVLPLSVWNTFSEKVDMIEQDTYLRVLAFDDAGLDETQAAIKESLGNRYEIEIENRVQEEKQDAELWKGYMIIIGSLCALLAVIGIANIFSNTLGFIYQRKREFARYLSIGVTPEGIRKILCIEALSVAGRPILITLPLTVLFVAFAVTASYLDPMEFIVQMPLLPIGLFILLIFLFVGLAYYIGGKKIFQCNLSEALKDDTMI